jgi:DHA1 family tetracycline resistance protein-like MFS transporter
MELGSRIKKEFSFIQGNYKILFISWIIMDIAWEMPNPNFQYYVEALGGTEVSLGIIGLANFLGMAIVAFPGGYLADKCGRQKIISIMSFGIALSFLFFAFAPTWEFILLGTIASSLCLIYQPALFAMVQDSLPHNRRGMGSSLIELIHGSFNTPGPIIAGFLLLQFGLIPSMRIIYLIMTTLFLTAAIWRLKLKETMEEKDPIKFHYFITLYAKSVKEGLSIWKKVPRSILWVCIIQAITMFGFSLTRVINAIYARDVLSISQNQWWLTFVPLLLTMVIASIPIGKLVDVVGRKIPMALGSITFAMSTLLFVFGNFTIVMISMILYGISLLLLMTSINALITDYVQKEKRGRVNGFVNFTSYTSQGTAMLMGGFLFSEVFPQSPFFLSLVLVIPILLIILFKVDEPEKHSEPQLIIEPIPFK